MHSVSTASSSRNRTLNLESNRRYVARGVPANKMATNILEAVRET